jgi:hypothetical protein
LRDGWSGELWSAHGRATGRAVLLRRLPVADDLATHDRIRRAAARLVGVEHPHLVALRGVLSVESAVVLVHDEVSGVALDELLGERPLAADQVVTLTVPLAQALAELHRHGLVHGRVCSSAVLVADDGRPMLTDAGMAALLDLPHRALAPPDDVRDLASTCLAALEPGSGRGALGTVLTAAMVDEPTQRPTASDLAAAVFATGSAAPIRAGGPDPQTSDPAPTAPANGGRADHRPPRTHRRTSAPVTRPFGRRWAATVVALAATSAAALTGLAWAGADPGVPGSTVAPRSPASAYDVTAVTPRWQSVLVALDTRRAAAFAGTSARRLSGVYAADAPALRRDRAQLADLAAAGLHVERLHVRPRSVRVLTSSARRVVLAVVDVLDAYELRDARGSLVGTRPGRGATSWRVSLVRERGDWRIYDVVAS